MKHEGREGNSGWGLNAKTPKDVGQGWDESTQENKGMEDRDFGLYNREILAMMKMIAVTCTWDGQERWSMLREHQQVTECIFTGLSLDQLRSIISCNRGSEVRTQNGEKGNYYASFSAVALLLTTGEHCADCIIRGPPDSLDSGMIPGENFPRVGELGTRLIRWQICMFWEAAWSNPWRDEAELGDYGWPSAP